MTSFNHCCYRLPPEEIAYVRFVLESYDGIGWIRTLDPRVGLVEISYPACQAADADRLLKAIADETGMSPVDFPGDYHPL